MSCGCGTGPSKYSPEYTRRYKPENNVGCCCGSTGNCDTPSRALEGTPRWEWEQEYGKLVTKIVVEQDLDGIYREKVKREPCPLSKSSVKNNNCCIFRYKIQR